MEAEHLRRAGIANAGQGHVNFQGGNHKRAGCSALTEQIAQWQDSVNGRVVHDGLGVIENKRAGKAGRVGDNAHGDQYENRQQGPKSFLCPVGNRMSFYIIRHKHHEQLRL